MKKIFNISILFIIALAVFIIQCNGNSFEEYKKERLEESHVLTPDNTPPSIANAVAIANDKVTVLFSEVLNSATATDSLNYHIQGNNRVDVVTAVLESDEKTVTLTVSTSPNYRMQQGKSYTLLVQNVSDISNNKIIYSFATFLGIGPVVSEIWRDTVKMPESGPYSYINSTSMDLTIQGTGVVSYQYSIYNDPVWSVWSSEIPVSDHILLSGLSEGYHSVKVIGKNVSGVWQDTNQATTTGWTVDQTPPTAVLSHTPANVTAVPDIDIIVSGTGAVSYQYKINSESFNDNGIVPISNRISRMDLPDGDYTLSVIAIDEAGNAQSQSLPTTYSWTISRSMLVAVLLNTPAKNTNITFTDIIVSGADVLYYEYSLDNGFWSLITGVSETIRLTDLPDGEHNLKVRGFFEPLEFGGQPEESATEYTWTVDTIDPVCLLTNLPASFTNSQNTYITVAGDASKYRYRVNSGVLSGLYNVSDPIDLTALGEGPYTIKVMGIDEAGNVQDEASATSYSWTVDLTPPRAVLSGTPSNPSQVSSINVTVSGAGAVAYKSCLDSEDWSGEINISSPTISRVGLAEGSHTLSVVVRDTAGNWQSMQNSTDCVWIIDTDWPAAVLTDTPAPVTNIQSADITVTGVGVYKYEYSFDGSPYSTERELVTYPSIPLSDLTVGPHTISVIACDRAGNWQPAIDATIYTWTIDTDIPTAVLSNKPSAKTNSQSINITVGGNIVSYKYRVDGGAWGVETVIATPITQSGLSESSHTIDVIGKKTGPDQWQTVANATTYSWIIDISAPTAVLLTKPANPTSSQSASIQISGIGGVNTYRYSLDNPGIYGSDILLSENDTISLINLSAGDHTIYVLAKDEAGNEQASPTTYSWNVDTSVPVAVLSNTPVNPTNLQSMAVTVGGTNIVSYKYRLDGGTWSSEIDIVTHISRVGMAAGTHTVSAVGKNAAGSWQDTMSSTEYTWTIDITAPTASDITLSNLPANPTNSTGADITVGGTGIVKYMYKLDGGSWNSEAVVADHIILSGLLSPQSHTLYVIGCDAAGNWLNTSSAKTYTWSVDDTQALAVLSNVPADPTNSQSANITIGGVEDYRYRMDGGVWDDNGGSYYDAGTNPNINLSGLSEASHTIEVSGRNASLVEQSSPTTYTWTIDISPPTASLSNLPANPTTSTSANITVDGTGVVAYQYNVDAGIWLPSGSEKSVDFGIVLTGLSVGSHTIYVKGKDNAGNWQLDGSATSYSWTINPPPLVSPAVYDEGTNSTNSLLTFTWIKPNGAQDVKIQIAADSGFADIVYGGTNGVSVGNVSFYQFIVTATDKQEYYARVSVNASPGIPVSDTSWKAWGTASDGINIVGSVSGRVKDGISKFDVSGAQVDIMKMSDSSLIATTTTDSTGNFAFGNIPIGVNYYKLAISMATYNNTGKNNITVSQGDETNVGILFLILTSASAGTISGDVVNANDGVDVASATISVYTWDSVLQTSTTTNSAGNFTTSPTTVPAGVYSVKVSKAGYFDLLVDNVAVNGNNAIGTQALCEVLQEPQVRVVLLWGSAPTDLDLHLVGPTTKTITTGNTGVDPNNRFHTYWSGQRSFNENTGTYYASGDPGGVRSTTSLVQDDTSSYGPEAQNLFRWGGGQFARGFYTYTVHRWSNNGGTWGTEPITMRIYDSQGMARELNFPGTPSPDLRYWKAFKINIQGNSRAQRSIIILNQFGTLDYSIKSTLDW